MLCVQGLKKTLASKLGRNISGGSLWLKKVSCRLNLILAIAHALACHYCCSWSWSTPYCSFWSCFVFPHGRTWVNFFFFNCLQICGNGDGDGKFHNNTMTVFIHDDMFFMLLFFFVVLLLLVVTFYSSTTPCGQSFLLLMVTLCCSLWSCSPTPCG